MKRVLVAAGLSVALHGGVGLIFLREAAPTVVAVAGPREKPVQIEVMRLAGLVPRTGVTEPPAPAEPDARPPTKSKAKEPPGPGARPLAAEARAKEPAGPRGAPAPAEATAKEPDGSRARPLPAEANEKPPVEGAGQRAPGLDSAGPEPSTRSLADVPAQSPFASAARSASAGSSQPAGQPGGGLPLDTSGLSRRLQQVALRCYPSAARRFRQAGEVQLRFCLDPAGALRESTVLRGSGSELLDRAASECVVPGAAPFGPETFGRCFTVPVRFKP